MKTAGMLIMTAIWHIEAETDQFQLNAALQTKSTASVVMQETSHPFPRRTRNELRMERPFMRWTASSREDDRMRVDEEDDHEEQRCHHYLPGIVSIIR